MQSQVVTTDDQAALYRLTGDLHPVHIDPAAAQAAGFDRPILHGMCTLGAVTLQVARELHADPAGLADLDARLTSVVLPGDTLGVEIWPDGSSYAYRASSATGPAISGWGNYS